MTAKSAQRTTQNQSRGSRLDLGFIEDEARPIAVEGGDSDCINFPSRECVSVLAFGSPGPAGSVENDTSKNPAKFVDSSGASAVLARSAEGSLRS